MNYYNDLKKQHRKFGLSYDGPPHMLSRDEHLFRIGAMLEETWEYASSAFDLVETPDAFREQIMSGLSGKMLRTENEDNLASQLDALVDLCTFAIDTAARQGFDFNAAWELVVKANYAKELAGKAEASKRGFKADLVKPQGWRSPDIKSLMEPLTGVVIIEGPPLSGKTRLAKHLAEKHGGTYLQMGKNSNARNIAMLEELQGTALAARTHHLVVIDAHWVSDMVSASIREDHVANNAYRKFHNALNAEYIWAIPGHDSTAEEYYTTLKQVASERTSLKASEWTPSGSATKESEIMEGYTDVWRLHNMFVFGSDRPVTALPKEPLGDGIMHLDVMREWDDYDCNALNIFPGFTYDRFLDPYYEVTDTILTKRMRNRKAIK